MSLDVYDYEAVWSISYDLPPTS